MNLELRNKVALITGASQGIGLSIAEGLAAEGVHVILTARTKETLDKEGSRLSTLFPVQVLAIPCDVSSPIDIDRLALSVNLAFPDGIDILINNAGGNTEESIFQLLMKDGNMNGTDM
jgi:3-oxoacyl-[acyl-carrier protein] reductase